MTTTSLSTRGIFPNKFFLLILIAFVGWMLLNVSPLSTVSHAAKHLTDAELTRQCLSKNGPSQIWKKVATDSFGNIQNRKASVCIEGEEFFILIENEMGEITAFKRTPAKGIKTNLQEIIRYMKSTGWEGCIGLCQ